MQLRSNPAVVLVNGFSGSQENVAGGPILRRGGLGFVSGSATRASLTDSSTPDGHVLSNGYFHRVVPNDNAQGSVDVKFMLNKMGVKSGDTVMTVDQAEAYSVPLISLMTSLLQKAGVKVDRESQPATTTDFTSLAQKAVAEHATAVAFAGQVASNAQLFLQQLHADGFHGEMDLDGRHVRLDELQGAGRVHLVVLARHPHDQVGGADRGRLQEEVRSGHDLVRRPDVGRRGDDGDGDLESPAPRGTVTSRGRPPGWR